MDTNLEALRKAAGISQAEMATHLDISQSQVSRYEKNPDDVPMRVFLKWKEFCGYISSTRPLDLGPDDPMSDINKRIKLISEYFDAQPRPPLDFPIEQLEKANGVVTVDHLKETLRRVGRKPRVAMFGRFDMGKSRLSNMLMGGDSLPTSYQPATSIACLIRHIDDKPEWQPENVWIMKQGFDLDRPDDKKHCMNHRLIGGGYETLRDHGTHTKKESEKTFEDAAAAIVYINSDFLKGCDLIDLPGYQNHEGDDKRAEMARQIADIVIYVSLAAGFMNEQDRSYLAQLVRQLSPFESAENGLQPLRNLIVVATRADIAGNNPNQILDDACRNTFDGIGNTLIERGEQIGVTLNYDDLRSRFFTYSADNVNYRTDFNSDLKELLTEISPQRVLESVNTIVNKAKKNNTSSCDSLIESIEESLDNQKNAQKEISKVFARESSRIEKKNRHEHKVLSLIDSLKLGSLSDAKKIYSVNINVEKIEKIIKERYGNKKDAKSLAPIYITESLQRAIDKNIKEKSEKLSLEVESFLENYDAAIKSNAYFENQWNFNAKGAFLGALAGFGTFGALATWASLAAAGSNLGGYILAAKIVSVLSSIGIGVGSTASVISFISMLGGPVSVAIGISVAVGALITALIGSSWQHKLAKKIVKSFEKSDTEKVIERELSSFWDGTKNAFKHAAKETEKDFTKKIDALRRIAFESNTEILISHLEFVKELRDFFAGIPWKSSV